MTCFEYAEVFSSTDSAFFFLLTLKTETRETFLVASPTVPQGNVITRKQTHSLHAEVFLPCTVVA